jgi:hypothetical protein
VAALTAPNQPLHATGVGALRFFRNVWIIHDLWSPVRELGRYAH